MNVVERDGVRSFEDSPDEACESLDCLLRTAAYVRTRLSEFLDDFSLTEGRYSVLATLKSAGLDGLSQSELADRLMQSESNISTLVERMQRDGLLDRLRSDSDRRKWVLLLSPLGQRVLERVEAARGDWAVRLIRSIPVDNHLNLSGRLKRLDARLDAPVKEVPAPQRIARGTVPTDDTPEWGERLLGKDSEPHTPHVALQQILSVLGLIHQYAEDEA